MSLPVVRVTDGVTKRVIAAYGNQISGELLHALFHADIVGLECVDTQSNAVVVK